MNKALLLALVLALPCLSGCGGGTKPAGVQVDKAWERLPAAPGGVASGYFQAEANRPGETLVSVTAPGARIEMHESMEANHMVSMQPIASADFAGERLVFAPGGKHLMIYGLDQKLNRGGALALTLRFRTAPPVTVQARLIAAGDPPPRDGG